MSLTAGDGRRDSDQGMSAVGRRARQRSLIESFSISGLYGYRTIALTSQYAATILMAQNGSGKTTLLGALDAFLKAQFSRLEDVQFHEIRCKLRTYDNDLVVSYENVADFLVPRNEGEVAKLARRIDIPLLTLFRSIIEEYPSIRGDYSAMIEHRVFSAMLRAYDYDYQEIFSVCTKVREEAYAKNSQIYHVYKMLASAFQNVEILYLPTYRRIELSTGAKDTAANRKKFRVSGKSLFIGEIQFGLADIAERLSALNQQILVESNQGYRKISADIINELIDGTFDRETTSDTDLPELDELDLFFARIKQGGRGQRVFSDVSIPELSRISEQIVSGDPSSKFLRYFLAKLGAVIKATRDVEALVEAFVETCNKYLMAIDFSTSLNDYDHNFAPRSGELDGKRLHLNRKNLTVHVESIPFDRKMSIDALSSGEKQMVSLFAKMYLYPNKKIVLIDEPELSLSIEWQKQILQDVLIAPLCTQLIAITHSPFVFDNDLDPFARSLQSSIDDELRSRLFEEAEDHNE